MLIRRTEGITSRCERVRGPSQHADRAPRTHPKEALGAIAAAAPVARAANQSPLSVPTATRPPLSGHTSTSAKAMSRRSFRRMKPELIDDERGMPIAGRREKEPQRRHRTVHGRRLHALLALTNLEHTQILPLGRVRRAAEEDCEVLDVADVTALRLLAEAADRHVLDHATAKRADGRRRAHWGAPGLEVEVACPLDPQDRALPIPLPRSGAHTTPR